MSALSIRMRSFSRRAPIMWFVYKCPRRRCKREQLEPYIVEGPLWCFGSEAKPHERTDMERLKKKVPYAPS